MPPRRVVSVKGMFIPEQQADTLKVRITAKAKDGTTYDETFTFGSGTEAATARDAVLTSFQGAGWTVAAAGPSGISISKKGISEIQEVDAGVKHPARTSSNLNVTTGGSSGVKLGETTVGQWWKFSFHPFDLASQTLDTGGTVAARVFGTTVTPIVVFGDAPSQVALKLFSALSSAGIAATLSGHEITFLNDAQGQEILQAELTLNASGLEARMVIPERIPA